MKIKLFEKNKNSDLKTLQTALAEIDNFFGDCNYNINNISNIKQSSEIIPFYINIDNFMTDVLRHQSMINQKFNVNSSLINLFSDNDTFKILKGIKNLHCENAENLENEQSQHLKECADIINDSLEVVSFYDNIHFNNSFHSEIENMPISNIESFQETLNKYKNMFHKVSELKKNYDFSLQKMKQCTNRLLISLIPKDANISMRKKISYMKKNLDDVASFIGKSDNFMENYKHIFDF